MRVDQCRNALDVVLSDQHKPPMMMMMMMMKHKKVTKRVAAESEQHLPSTSVPETGCSTAAPKFSASGKSATFDFRLRYQMQLKLNLSSDPTMDHRAEQHRITSISCEDMNNPLLVAFYGTVKTAPFSINC